MSDEDLIYEDYRPCCPLDIKEAYVAQDLGEGPLMELSDAVDTMIENIDKLDWPEECLSVWDHEVDLREEVIEQVHQRMPNPDDVVVDLVVKNLSSKTYRFKP